MALMIYSSFVTSKLTEQNPEGFCLASLGYSIVKRAGYP
jgi:hypothetical protein